MAVAPHPPDVDRDVDLGARTTAQSAWTFGTLFLHLTDKIGHVETRLLDRMQAAADAVTIASEANNKRLDALNELRETVQDQQSRFTTKAEAEARLSALGDKVDALTKRMDSLGDTSAGASKLWLMLLGIFLAACSLGGILLQLRSVKP